MHNKGLKGRPSFLSGVFSRRIRFAQFRPKSATVRPFSLSFLSSSLLVAGGQILWQLGSMDAARPGAMDLDSAERAPLDEMNSREELIAAYSIQGFSATGHLLNIYKDRLSRERIARSSELSDCDSGKAVKVGGYNVCLQMPPTAKGFAFLTLEGEEGLINVVIRPDVYQKHRQLVRLESLS